jgi:hypothetical protein
MAQLVCYQFAIDANGFSSGWRAFSAPPETSPNQAQPF